MTRLELLVAAALFGLICVLAIAPSGYDQAVASTPLDASSLSSLAPYQRYFFLVVAGSVTLAGLLLEDGRRRDSARNAAEVGQPTERSREWLR